MNEMKITREQYEHLESIRYDLPQRSLYIKDKIIRDQYEITDETTFFTYKDKWHYYLCFDAEEIVTGKWKPKSIVDRLRDEKLKEN